MSEAETKTISALHKAWVWVPGWQDCAPDGSAGRVVTFTRRFSLDTLPSGISARLSFTADTRYKLYVNGHRVAVGPTRSCERLWYYDTLELAPWLKQGDNVVEFVVLRFFSSTIAAFPFGRTVLPGLTVTGKVMTGDKVLVDLVTDEKEWSAQVDNGTTFPTSLLDDKFLHVYERVSVASSEKIRPELYWFPKGYERTEVHRTQGELSPWHLQPRMIPLPEETQVKVTTIRELESTVAEADWSSWLNGSGKVRLPAGTSHHIVVQADCHSTAFLRLEFVAGCAGTLKVSYTEGYEMKPTYYPNRRNKGDRLKREGQQLMGPFDLVDLASLKSTSGVVIYEPFWFRTFRLLVIEINATSDVEAVSIQATQTNYPLHAIARWIDTPSTEAIWDISVRTLRNCTFDGYSDCPFYEQLQYTQDSRSSGLFHYMLSGDDRLMRQVIRGFGVSPNHEGLVEARYPSHIHQYITGFALFWVFQIHDHMMYFADRDFVRPFLPVIDRVLDYFHSKVDQRGLVSGIPPHHWQYIDWAFRWVGTEDHTDGGVPVAGRASNTHTYFSMLYAAALQRAQQIAAWAGRPSLSEEYSQRREVLVGAIQQLCFDGTAFTDSTVDASQGYPYSQHCQVWAVISGAIEADSDSARDLLRTAFNPAKEYTKCSYTMMHYAFRSFSLAGVYEEMWPTAWVPWRQMVAKNLSTCEEDEVSQRSDCHAWGSVALYEYPAEVAGVRPLEPGWAKVLFAPRLSLSESIECQVAMGRSNVASVGWVGDGGGKRATLRLKVPVWVVSRTPDGVETDHGPVTEVQLYVK